jgi:hypothetical protein
MMHSVNSLQFAQEGKNIGIYVHNYLTTEAKKMQEYKSDHF